MALLNKMACLQHINSASTSDYNTSKGVMLIPECHILREQSILTINSHREPYQGFSGCTYLSQYPSSIREEKLGNCDTAL